MNSLQLAPFAKTRRWNRVTKQWREVTTMLEYTSGKPGDQKLLRGETIDWRPNEPFIETLQLDRLERGRSAARFWFVGSDGTEYPFFGQGMVEMLNQVFLNRGLATGTWIAVKRGANYGLELFKEDA